MFDCFWGTNFVIFDHIDIGSIFSLILLRKLFEPLWNGCWKEKDLNFIFVNFVNLTKNFLDFLFKALFENLVSLIQTKYFNRLEFNIASGNKIIQPARSTNKNINTLTQSFHIFLDACLSIHTVSLKIFLILEFQWLNLIVNLNDKFSSG